MEMNALNSLAEVGVGLNLAFGLIQNVRRHLLELLNSRVEIKVSAIKTILSESPLLNGRNPASTAIKVEDIAQRFCNWSEWGERLFVSMAFIVAIALVYFLFESAICPNKEIPIYWAIATLVLLTLPIGLSALWQICLYWYTLAKLSRREGEYKSAVELMEQAIDPASPEDKTAN